jgi:serine/threonine protein kinase
MEPTPTSSRARWVPPTPEELQAQLTGYQVLELLGLGGMGAVYKGWQNSLDRHIAIKVLPPGLTEEDEQFAARFKHEARTMARLSHPAIVGVHDYGETAEGLCYIVMEFIEGTDVQKMMGEQEKLPAEHALAIALNVCDALVYAHEHGIIHRDIKPANVMVDTQGRVRVADFGLAKATDASGTLLTGSHIAVGTPGYIAPETLIMGMGVDARADVYAVGVMLYAMLTGRVPHGRFEAASVRVPGLDPRFDDIINRAMQDEREARYPTVAELRADLATILAVPQEAASEQLARVASSDQLQKSRDTPAPPEAPRARIPLSLIGLATVAVCAIGLQVWKPWAKSGGPQASNSKEGSSSKAQGKVAIPSEKTGGIPVSSSNPTTQASKATPPGESGSGNAAPPTPPAAARDPKAMPAPVAQMAAATLTKPTEAVASASPTPLPPPASAPAVPVAAAPATLEKVTLPAELATLHEQFQKLQVERVGAPFEADVAKLNASYIGGLEREMTKEKAAGHLDAILALEAEKKLLNDNQPVPSLEEESASGKETFESLKKLRTIYREAHAKLEAQRAVNLKTITDPLVTRLATLETDLTKKDRIADAKLVREYRDSLGSALGAVATETDSTAGTARAIPARLVAPTMSAVPLKDGFTNTLGMKFADVPGTEVLFCIHETRRQDYAAYATEVSGVDGVW